jgi:hypothetical protein
MAISKIEAAQRQLDCAIRLYFAEDDVISVHTLSRAAFRLLYDIYPTLRDDGFSRDLERLIAQFGWRSFNEAANFLKHANTDVDGTLELREEDTQMGIGFAIVLYRRLSTGYTPEMRSFDEWMKVSNPDKFNIPPDPDPEIELAFREAVEFLKTTPRSTRLLMPNALLKFFREHPEGGNAWAKPPEPKKEDRN